MICILGFMDAGSPGYNIMWIQVSACDISSRRMKSLVRFCSRRCNDALLHGGMRVPQARENAEELGHLFLLSSWEVIANE